MYIIDDVDWLQFCMIICIVLDQIVLVFGYLQEEIMVDGWCCFCYVMDWLMFNFYVYLLVCWEVKWGCYRDILIEVYYDLCYVYNVDCMIEVVQKLMVYYEVNFILYQYCQVCIIEFFGYQSFVQFFVNIIFYFELIGFIVDLCDLDDVDYVFYVIVYEIVY